MDESDEITEHERIFNKEFFINNSTKTPHRYIRIRNFCISAWKAQKPKCLTKTTVRVGLKDCGDVNAIGRVHEYLERLGVINFGCKKRKYSRRRSDKKKVTKKDATSKETTPVSSPAKKAKVKSSPSKPNYSSPIILPKLVEQPFSNFNLDQLTDAIDSVPVDDNDVQFKEDDSENESSTIIKLSAKKRKRKRTSTKKLENGTNNNINNHINVNNDTFLSKDLAVSCRNHDTQPFDTIISIQAYITMNIHSYLSSNLNCGLLGGSFDALNKKLLIEICAPCTSIQVSCLKL